MSHEWMKPAYKTRLGNLPAKSVLVLIADQVNADGFGWPSINFIVDGTEINKRTVQRVIQVFEKIDLIKRIDRGPKRTPGLQLNLELLGADLTARFAEQFRAVQGSNRRVSQTQESVSQTQESVSQTQESVSQTQESVSQTFPPHPLIGVPVNDPLTDPLMTHSPCSADAEHPPPEKPCLLLPEMDEMPAASGKAEMVLTTWNEAVKDTPLPKAKRLNPTRLRAIHSRLRERGWFAEFEAACRYVAADASYQGKNRANWVCDLDYLLQPGRATQVAEKAANNPNPYGGMYGTYNRAQERTNGNLAALAAVRARRDRARAGDSGGSAAGVDQCGDPGALCITSFALRTG